MKVLKIMAAELTNLTETQGLTIGKELSNLIQRNGEKQWQIKK